MVPDQKYSVSRLHRNGQLAGRRTSSLVDDDPVVDVLDNARASVTDADESASNDGSRFGQKLGEVGV